MPKKNKVQISARVLVALALIIVLAILLMGAGMFGLGIWLIANGNAPAGCVSLLVGFLVLSSILVGREG